MAVYNKIRADLILPYSNENAAASFYRWLNELFNHDAGYSVVFDQELRSPGARRGLPLPCLAVTQLDTTDPSRGFVGALADQNTCLFYVYCIVAKGNTAGGVSDVRLLRRMKDHVVFALKRAGIFDDDNDDVVVPPITLFDFSKKPIVPLNSTLTLNSGIVQHYTEEDDILQYELLVSFRYMVDGKTKGA